MRYPPAMTELRARPDPCKPGTIVRPAFPASMVAGKCRVIRRQIGAFVRHGPGHSAAFTFLFARGRSAGGVAFVCRFACRNPWRDRVQRILRPAAPTLFLLLATGPGAGADLAGWHPDAARQCLLPPYEQAETEAQRSVRDLVDEIEGLDPAPDPLIGILGQAGTALCIEDRPTIARGAYTPERNLIELRADLDFGERLLILIHELRHLDQYGRGFCPSTEFDLKEYERFTYMLEADAQAVATYYAWKLREADRPDAWEAIARFGEYADIGAAFADRIGEGAAPEEAVAAAFDAWFDPPWRVETYRLSSCSAYLDRLDETKLLRSYDLLPEGYFASLCTLPDGSAYSCTAPQ